MLLHELANLVDLIDRNRKIQIETDQRLDVGVDRLPADHAEAHSVVLEQREDLLQEIGFVQSDGLPEGECFHGAGVLRLVLPRRGALGLPCSSNFGESFKKTNKGT